MIALALDPGKTTGWAYHDDAVRSGSFVFDQIDHGERMYRFRLWLESMIYVPPKLVIWDKALPFKRATPEAECTTAMSKYIEEACWNNNIKRLIAPMNSVKKAVLGNGRATNSDVMKWAEGQGFYPANVHEADAIVLLTYGMEQ